MWMTFQCCHHNGVPNGQKMCFSLASIEAVFEMGQWGAAPMAAEIQFDDNPRTTARPRTTDGFIPTPNVVSIQSKNGNQYQVVANFTELSQLLVSLNDIRD